MSDGYRVVVTREGDNWLADLPDLVGAHTFARSLPTLERYVREVVVLAEDLPDEAADGLFLHWEFHTGDEQLDRLLNELRARRAELAGERAEVEHETADLARKLEQLGFSVRDSGKLLGVSPQRVQQLSTRTSAA